MKTYKLSNNAFWWEQWHPLCDCYPEYFNYEQEPTDHFRIIKKTQRWLHIEMSNEASKEILEQAKYRSIWFEDLDEPEKRACRTIVRQITNQA